MKRDFGSTISEFPEETICSSYLDVIKEDVLVPCRIKIPKLTIGTSIIPQITVSRIRDPLLKIYKQIKTAQTIVVDIDTISNYGNEAIYAKKIFKTLRDREALNTYRPLTGYLIKVQLDMSARQRQRLLDWVFSVSEEYECMDSTIFQTVSLLDRYLSIRPAMKKDLQLVILACFFIAQKINEIGFIRASDLLEYACYVYSMNDLFSMESTILKTLDWRTTDVVAVDFIKRFCFCFAPCEKAENLAIYFSEICLYYLEMSKHPPSKIAAASVALARFHLKMEYWNLTIEHHSGYTMKTLRPCIDEINDLQREFSTVEFTTTKARHMSPLYSRIEPMEPSIITLFPQQ